jgi:hypothetical protein
MIAARKAAYAKVCDDAGLDPIEGDPRTDWMPDEEPDRYALIQVDPGTDDRWITTHASARDALDYAERDEGEWQPRDVVDLDSGEMWAVVTRYELAGTDGGAT